MTKSQDWYFRVNEYCQTISETYSVPLIKVAGIMSALSPNNTFASNVKSLEAFLRTKGNCKVSTYNGQKIKALTILNSPDTITIEEVKKILGGLLGILVSREVLLLKDTKMRLIKSRS